MNVSDLEEKIIFVLEQYGADRIGIFGSFAREEANAESDLDLLVHFKDQQSLLTLVQIERELTERTGIKVDLLTEQSVSPYLIDQIKSELKVIYQ
ncbi:MAG: nucleotidyltransferase family protein [Proteobacteria bacterium]|nr:nucleotidyltransferase family protein [Pseudomonadota bacterium]